MDKDQAKDVLLQIAAAYPMFEVDDMRIKVWTKQLLKMPYAPVIRKLEDYMTSEKFPPTIADISVFLPPKNEFLEKVKRWEAEAERDRKTRER